ncbi:Sodium-driven chloride bicarbonate exchanger [Lonchura striata]|uniref:Anion exchange protein n=1 Tax=Lonchura striata TaxID=40157 RepID=A0A218UIR6_9PASE|nr:Sodium-driven chloride bicarbonate exchanger [Lonchura striata domestica]
MEEERAGEQMRPLLTTGHDEEAVVDMGKISSTINTNFEKEELEKCEKAVDALSCTGSYCFSTLKNHNGSSFWLRKIIFLFTCVLLNFLEKATELCILEFTSHLASQVVDGIDIVGTSTTEEKKTKKLIERMAESLHHTSEAVGLGPAVCMNVQQPALNSMNSSNYLVSPFLQDTPSQRVQFILGTEDDDEHIPHDLFTEMDELCFRDGEEYEWRETARWLKFEEDVEDGGDRWSKPYVATLSLHSLFELRSFILNGTVMLDMRANTLDEIADMVLDSMIASGQLDESMREKVREALLKRHHHQNEKKFSSRIPLVRSFADIGKKHSDPHLLERNDALFSKHENFTHTDLVLPILEHLYPQAFPPLPRNLSCQNLAYRFYCVRPVNDSMPDTSSIESRRRQINKAQVHDAITIITSLLASPQSAPGNLDTGKSGDVKGTGTGGSRENSTVDFSKVDMNFMRKIPSGAEASNVLVGEVDFLERPIIAFVRLSPAVLLSGLTEVPVPTRFLFLLLGPAGKAPQYHEIGRSIATLMTDDVFHDVAYKAKDRNDLLSGIDEFLDQVTVLPPGEWDPSIRIEPPKSVPSQVKGKKSSSLSCRIYFLIKGRHLNFQMDLLLQERVLKKKAIMLDLNFRELEGVFTFLNASFRKEIEVINLHLNGLHLNIKKSWDYGLSYLSLRTSIGLWTAFLCIVLVATDASSLVCYITRFTEEAFAALICIIFIYEALEKLVDLGEVYPFNMHNDLNKLTSYSCVCSKPEKPSNETLRLWRSMNKSGEDIAWSNLTVSECLEYHGVFRGSACGHHGPYIPDVLFWSVILFFATFFLSSFLKKFKTKRYFPTKVRSTISDFAVFLTIVIMVLIDYFVGVPSPKLQVPEKFEPTRKDRGWFIDPLGSNPWWTLLIAALPALLCTILIFMDQQITAVIINRKEHKLKKGCGYHLDLLMVGIMLGICSIMGLPWYVAATVLSISHVNSLKVESECSAPGEQPKFLGIREQRVTGLMIFVLMGMSVSMTSVLKFIPMPVLYGVFLYMGVSSLKGIQFFDRIKLFGMPAKHQPDLIYLRYVPLWKVHIFTVVQLTCLVLLWVIKASAAAVVFPMMVLALVFIRKLMDLCFTKKELSWLDDLMPESKKKRDDDEKIKEKEEAERMFSESDSVHLAYGEANLDFPVKTLKYSIDPSVVNISDEMAKTAQWKALAMSTENAKVTRANLSAPDFTFSFLFSNSPEKPESVKIEVENSPVVRYVDAETSL